MKKIVLSLLAFFFVHFGFGQLSANIDLPKIIPPTPISMEFQRFLGYSANGSTGTVDISIPLLSIDNKDVKLPFFLKYNSSGIKVDQPSGIVGYGWSLFPGLKITRTIIGKKDEHYLTNNIQTQNDDVKYLVKIALPSSDVDGGNMSEKYDGQFDIFTFHLPEKNGTFMLKVVNNEFKAISLSGDPINISPIVSGTLPYANIVGFIIRDESGNIYSYGVDNQTTNNVEYIERSGNGDEVGWNLKEVKNYKGLNKITFHYVTAADGRSTSLGSMSILDKCNVSGTSGGSVYDQIVSILGVSPNNYIISNYAPSYYSSGTSNTLKSVDFENGKLEFVYTTSGLLKLQDLKLTALGGDLVKQINFTYIASNTLLENITIKDVSGNISEKYSLSYNSTRFDDNAIFNQDWWGYYNNKGNIGSLIPKTNMVIHNGTQQVGYADRSIDANAMKANMLEKIVYPTGGSSEFEYEPNQFIEQPNYGAGLRIKTMKTYDPSSNTTITKSYKYGINESGYGKLNYSPTIDTFIDEKYLLAGADIHRGYCRRRTLSPYSKYQYFNYVEPVWYPAMTEYTDGGKTVYEYEYEPSLILEQSPQAFTTLFEFSHIREIPVLMQSSVFTSPLLTHEYRYKFDNSNYSLVQDIKYDYTTVGEERITNMIVDPILFFVNNGTPSNIDWYYPNSGALSFWSDISYPFVVYKYDLLKGKKVQTGMQKKSY
ncbi:hypothetical protein ABID42_004718 [Arcicella rosea]|uniref:hypothetical protein n=1 Tax=Arcicella rosea TaxID=502909 RepID=UPI00345CAAE2